MQPPTDGTVSAPPPPAVRADWLFLLRTVGSSSPSTLTYVALLAIPFIEVDPRCYALLACSVLVVGLGISGGLHRYFSHRSYKTSRAVQFLIGCLGCLALQKGPLWWAAKHRIHHRHSDGEHDPHSPVLGGFWHGHMGWLFARHQLRVDYNLVKDLARYPELVWLDRLWMAPGLLFGAACYFALDWGGAIVGYLLAVAIAHQITFAVNSLGHLFGPQRFATGEGSRNNIVLGYLAMGDGWHNNHHRFPYSARHGFAWYELDVTYLFVRVLARLGLVWDVRLPPEELLAGHDTRAVAQSPTDPPILSPDEEQPAGA